jgi:hypothetical protein
VKRLLGFGLQRSGAEIELKRSVPNACVYYGFTRQLLPRVLNTRIARDASIQTCREKVFLLK